MRVRRTILMFSLGARQFFQVRALKRYVCGLELSHVAFDPLGISFAALCRGAHLGSAIAASMVNGKSSTTAAIGEISEALYYASKCAYRSSSRTKCSLNNRRNHRPMARCVTVGVNERRQLLSHRRKPRGFICVGGSQHLLRNAQTAVSIFVALGECPQ